MHSVTRPGVGVRRHPNHDKDRREQQPKAMPLRHLMLRREYNHTYRGGSVPVVNSPRLYRNILGTQTALALTDDTAPILKHMVTGIGTARLGFPNCGQPKGEDRVNPPTETRFHI